MPARSAPHTSHLPSLGARDPSVLARRSDGLWDGGAFVPAHFTRELWEREAVVRGRRRTGMPSRWRTIAALRVLRGAERSARTPVLEGPPVGLTRA